MLYDRGAVMSRQVSRRSDAPAARLPASTAREDIAMLLRLAVVALLAVGAAAAVIGFAPGT